MGSMGMFGHLPTPDEVEARAFVMGRELQAEWSWPSYACGLSDAGVPDDIVTMLLLAGARGEMSHNIDGAFDYELEDDCED